MTMNTETKTPKVLPSENVQTVQEEEDKKEEELEEEEEEEELPTRTPYIELAMDEEGEWHWCLWATNGRPMAVSLNPFKRRNDAHKNVNSVIELFRSPKLKIVATV